MTRRRIANVILERIRAAGVTHTFGIPGDFVLPFYAAQAETDLQTVVMTHEPSVGFAADAYARIRGLGVAIVTYGAGGLNMVNPVGLAYAEESPVLVISGGPEVRLRSGLPHLHHCVKSFETQRDVFAHVTASATILDDPATAVAEIDRVLDTIARTSRPGYIELPRDMVDREVVDPGPPPHPAAGAVHRPAAVAEAVAEISARMRGARRAVMMVGAQVRRFGVRDAAVSLAEALGLPVVTSILGKAAFPESHPQFAGNYFGRFGDPAVADFVEDADCILCVGAVLTEMETAGYTARFEPEYLVQLNAHETVVGHHVYPEVRLADIVNAMLAAAPSASSPRWCGLPAGGPRGAAADAPDDRLTVAGMIAALDRLIAGSDCYAVITDTGDCMYAGMGLRTDIFLAPGHYVSMGFAVPAAVGAQLALPARRPVVLVGDGAFQMTGLEIATATKLGLNPIVVLFDNGSYAMLRFIDRQRDYYRLDSWDFAGLARAVGAEATTVDTQAGFASALARAVACERPFLIDAVISADDISPTLRRLTEHVGRKVRNAAG